MSKNLFTLSAAMLLILLTGLAFSGLSWRPSAAMNTGAAPVPSWAGMRCQTITNAIKICPLSQG